MFQNGFFFFLEYQVFVPPPNPQMERQQGKNLPTSHHIKPFRSLILDEHYFWKLLFYTVIEMFSYLLHVVLVEQLKHRESEHFAANKMKMLKSKT